MVSLHIAPGFVARVWRGAAAIVFVALQPASLLAAVDLTGDYRVDGEIGFVDVCTASIVQTGSALTYNGLCVGGASYQSATGTIDTVTGEFTLSGICEVTGAPPVPPQPPGPFVFSGIGSQDSLTFTMNGTCAGIDYIMHGTKCGNGIADANELCEDGNRDDGDCCSSTCTPETGNECEAGGPICTIDQCDSSGICVAGAVLAPAGSACDTDGDLCSEDICDGAGACSSTGATVTCSPCRACDSLQGCLPNPSSADRSEPEPGVCQDMTSRRAKATIVNRLSNDAKDQLAWNAGKGPAFSAADFGTPTSTTDYTLCIFDKISNAVLGELEIPAGPNWSPISGGYRFKSASGETPKAKVQLQSAGSSSKIKVRAIGAEIGFPELFHGGHLNDAQVELRASNGKCWVSTNMKRDPFKNKSDKQKINVKWRFR